MAVPPCGTFDYVAIVPDAIEDGAFECLAESREAVPMTGNRLVDSRLVGLAPLLTVSDASLPERTHGGHPEAMRSPRDADGANAAAGTGGRGIVLRQ